MTRFAIVLTILAAAAFGSYTAAVITSAAAVGAMHWSADR